MNYINKISAIKRTGLNDLRRIVNKNMGQNFINEELVERWKNKTMTPAERSSAILAKLSTAGLAEEKIKKIYEQLFPWWAPYWLVLKIMTILIVIFLLIQSITFLTADRIYSIEFRQEISYDDGSKEDMGLFENNTLILRNKNEPTQFLQRDNWLNWILNTHKVINSDSSGWTDNKGVAEKLQTFFIDFKQNTITIKMSELKNLNLLRPLKIYNSIKNILPNIDDYHIDLKVPNMKNKGIADNPISVCNETIAGTTINYFFCTLINSSNDVKYIQIDSVQGAQKFDLTGKSNNNKIVWVNNLPNGVSPQFYLIDSSGNHLDKYIKDFNKNYAYK